MRSQGLNRKQNTRRLPAWPLLTACLTAGIVLAAGAPCAAQETVNITLPGAVSFAVINVSTATTGGPNPATITYDSASLTSGHYMRISIEADSANFTRPAAAGGSIPAGNVSWTAGGATGGTGYGGTLSATMYTRVFDSETDPSVGSANLTWTLAAPGDTVRAGDHTLTATWKIESMAP